MTRDHWAGQGVDTVPFVDHFGQEPEVNERLWERSPDNPVIRYGDAWCLDFIACSSLLVDGDTVSLYAEGGVGDRECIGRYTGSRADAFSAGWRADTHNPLLEPSADGFDRGSVFDPAVVRFDGRTHLYYSATAGGAHVFAERAEAGAHDTPDDETIGHAIERPEGFDRDAQPVIAGRCPYGFTAGEELYLFYVKVVAGGYRIYGARSSNGTTFTPLAEGRAILAVGAAGEWDSFTVTTPKVFADAGQFLMLYAGSDRLIDDPTGIGVAVSTDLVNWHKHPGNPILRSGETGAFDSLSVASALPIRVGGRWHTFYTGTARPVAEGLQSQIGIAGLPVMSQTR